MSEKKFSIKTPLIIEDMTVREVREALKTVKTALLPIGCTEQHGYHLPICTDSLIAESVSFEVAKQVPIILLPTLKYSYSGGFLEGTVQINPQTVYSVVKDLLESLILQGFKGIVIESGHGGGEHMAAIKRAAEQVTLTNQECFISINGAYSEMAREILKGLVGTTHATTVETSLVKYLRSELVRDDHMVWEDRPKMKEEPVGPDVFIVRKQLEAEKKFNAKVKMGVGADPSKGTAEIGKKIFEEKVKNLIILVKRMNDLVGQLDNN